jgi:heme iron utilization protein
VTLLGTVESVASGERASAQAAYLGRHPQAADYLALADFHLYVLRVQEARFIGGFGDMGWLAGEPLRAALRSS